VTSLRPVKGICPTEQEFKMYMKLNGLKRSKTCKYSKIILKILVTLFKEKNFILIVKLVMLEKMCLWGRL
jgi:hypothetical protein